MKKLIRTSLMAMICFAIFLGNVAEAQAQIPSKFQGEVGFGIANEPFFGGDSPLAFDPVYNPPPITRLHGFSMPPVLELNTHIAGALGAEPPPSTAMFVYTQSELGTNGSPVRLGGIRIPILTYDGYWPYDLHEEFYWRYNFGAPWSPPAPTADAPSIRIQMRNVPTSDANTFHREVVIPASSLVDGPEQNDWKTVWNDEWNHYTNTFSYFETVEGNGNLYTFLVIEFDTPFDYSGQDVWIAITNTETTTLSRPFTYGFLTYVQLDEDTGNRFLGGKYLSDVICGDWSVTNQFFYGNLVDFFNWPYSNVSVRPAMKFDFPLMTTASTNPNIGNSYHINDSQYVMATLNVVTQNSNFPLKLTELTFNTTGTQAGVGITRARIYKSNTPTITTVAGLELLGTINNLTGNIVFTPTNAVQLAEGNNYFIIVYEVPFTNACGANLGIGVVSYKVGERVNAAITGDLTPHTVQVNETNTVGIVFTPVSLINNDNKEPRVCYNVNGTITFYVQGSVGGGSISGAYIGFKWERSADGIVWELLPTETQNPITFAHNLNYTYYRGTVIGPDCNFETENAASVIYHITYETPHTDIFLYYIGDLNPTELLVPGDELFFRADLDAGLNTVTNTYIWEYSFMGGPWINLAVNNYIANTANYTFNVTSSTFPGSYEIRVRATSATYGGCKDTVTSQTFPFEVEITDLIFDFVNQPEPAVTLCPNATLNLMVSFYGDLVAAESYWMKDGAPLRTTTGALITSRFLTRTGLTFLDNGEYYYRATANVSRYNEELNGYEIVKEVFESNKSLVTVRPPLEIFLYPQKENYALPGDMVKFTVTSSYVSNEFAFSDNYGYQWYKFEQGKGHRKLEDNKFFKGTRSNQLVITDILSDSDSSAYTFNGDYYYFRISTPCGTAPTTIREIYLYPGEQLNVSQDMPDAAICSLGDIAEFEVTVDYDEPSQLTYQWFIDGVAASNNGRISGVNTRKLTINPTEDEDLGKEIYCRVSVLTNPNLFATSNTATIAVAELEFVQKYPDVDELQINRGTLEVIALQYQAIPILGSTITPILKINGVVSPGIISDDFVVAYPILAMTLGVFEYELIVINQCDDTVSAKWTIEVVQPGSVIDNPTCIDEFTSINSVLIVPNPVNDIVAISFNSEVESHTSIELSDLSGARIATLFDGMSIIGLNKLEYNLNNLGIASGTYIIQIQSANGATTKQFIFIK